MPPHAHEGADQTRGPADFRTTHWSVVLTAGDSRSPSAAQALEELCRTYWYPVYAFLRRDGKAPHDAEDLAQEFFARLLRLHSFAEVAPHKGRFRTFLLASLKHFLADARDAASARKRGGGQAPISLDAATAEERYRLEPVTHVTPEVLYERRWLASVLEQALRRLGAEYGATGKAALFERLRAFLDTPTGDGEYQSAAGELGLNPGAVAVAVHRLRQRYRDLVRDEIAQTVSSPEELAEELRHWFAR